MKRGFLGLAVLLLLSAFSCRTTLTASRKGPANEKYVGDDQCEVFDYPVAAEVPEGAAALGRVEVRQEEGEDDESTMIRLRKKVCELGGNAMSDPRWAHGESESIARIFTANAWLVP